jgi:hypothetical protein
LPPNIPTKKANAATNGIVEKSCSKGRGKVAIGHKHPNGAMSFKGGGNAPSEKRPPQQPDVVAYLPHPATARTLSLQVKYDL